MLVLITLENQTGERMSDQKGFTLIELLIVVAIIGILASIAIPYLLNALERAKQTTTIERVSALGKHVEQYIMDHNNVGCPKIGNDINALLNVFQQVEINFNASYIYDGWGNEIVVDMEAALGGRMYTIMSYGADQKAGPDPATPGIVKLFSEDIIWSQGIFKQRPEGTQKSK